MDKINYVIGDATAPQGDGLKIIVHVCNDIGAWGAGFVLALTNKWSEPERMYRNWSFSDKGYHLGAIQYVSVESDIIVCNLIGQHGIGNDRKGNPPIRYGAIRTGLRKLNIDCTRQNATIHMPRIGCGLAGGMWSEIEKIINEEVTVQVTVYNLN